MTLTKSYLEVALREGKVAAAEEAASCSTGSGWADAPGCSSCVIGGRGGV
jgi:hypothetical protein